MICAFPASGLAAFWHHLLHYFFSSKTLISPDDGRRLVQDAGMFNSSFFDTMEWRKQILDNVMEALADPTIHIIGVYGPNYDIKDGLLLKVRRRIDRDSLFDVVLTATISKKPNIKSIQEEIAGQLGFHFSDKSENKRASELFDRIKNKHKILVILRNLRKGVDLGKVGVPFGADHRGCKILVTTEHEEVLSNEMHNQKIFQV